LVFFSAQKVSKIRWSKGSTGV